MRTRLLRESGCEGKGAGVKAVSGWGIGMNVTKWVGVRGWPGWW